MSPFYTNVFQRNGRFFVRGYHDDGESFTTIVNDYEPYIFLDAPSGPYRTIHGDPVAKKTFKGLHEAYNFLKLHKDATNFTFYGMTQFVYPYINDTFPGKVTYNHNYLSIVSLDIEVSSANGFPDVDMAAEEVTAITMVRNGKSITFGLKEFIPKNKRSEYVQCIDEKDMLSRFLRVWNSDDWLPDVVTGWSADMFDIPYLVHRITRVLGERAAKRLSPFGQVERREIIRSKDSTYKNFADRKDVVYDLQGIAILDYLQLYKKFTFTNHPSYRLNEIAKYELKKSKLQYEGTLNELYERDPQTYYEYNIEDSFLVEELETKKRFIQFVVSLAYEAKINYVDALGTLRPWDVIIHNFLLDRFIVVPQYHTPISRGILGGYVKNSQVGLHRWIVSFDFKGLYPSILIQHNISPETFVDKVVQTDPNHIVDRDIWPVVDPQYSYCANGTTFRRDKQGFIPEIVELYVNKRDDLKAEMKRLRDLDKEKYKKEISILDNQQQAVKILNNGLYGALSNQYFRWYDANLAEAVTYTAQTCTRYVEKHVNEWFNEHLKSSTVDYVIAADTDSIYINLEPILDHIDGDRSQPYKVTEKVDNFCKKTLGPYIQSLCDDLCTKYNVYKPNLFMKHEAIAEKVIWRAPKMYAMNLWQFEGERFKEPELKIKGIEIVRSSTPMICRDKLKEAVKIVMNKDEKSLQDFVETFRKEYLQLPFEVIANPRSISGLVTYADPNIIFAKGSPIHVRGSLIYNHAIKTLDLDKKYPYIKDKDKIKFLYLVEPNPFNTHVIAAPDKLPPEFELDEYIDYNMQFDKTFLRPIRSLTDLLEWRTEAINDLAEFL